MTQAQFFAAVSEGAQLSKVQVRAVFAAVEEVVKKSLKNEGKIPLGGPEVVGFGLARPDAGGWGATVVKLRPTGTNSPER